jgi:nucleoside-diphosphate-sugar epimerase
MRRDDVRTGHRAPAVPGLSEPDFRPLAVNGFGDPANSYVHCMAQFCGSVYAGTSRHSMALLRLFPPLEPAVMDPWPVRVPGSVDDLDMHGQIWRLRPDSDTWERAYTSPDMPGKQGRDVPRDLGYRGMTVFQGGSDDEPALYVGAISTVLRGGAARLLRSCDGEHFEAVGEPGLGNPNVSTLRAMTGFDGHLYVPPAGEGITFNSNSASVIMRAADPVQGPWLPACDPGFGDEGNTGVFEMEVFAGHLYAGTFNAREGYQVWKTPAAGGRACRWTKVLDQGASRGPRSEIAMSMTAFGDALYIGSAVQNGGYDRVNKVGPAASELVRLYADDSWDLLVGEPRQTPQGWKEPLSGMGPGLDNQLAGYFWRMAVHQGWLYLSTFDGSVFLPVAGRPSRTVRRLVEAYGMDQILRMSGGFELWRTRDGVDWVPVTTTGFDNAYNYGARTLLPTSRGLFVGTANPFAPETPARMANGWHYVPNPRGGAEVWLGAAAPQRRQPRRRRGGARLLLTGATGFIGSRLLEVLRDQDDQVRILALPGTVEALPDRSDVDPVIGSLDDEHALREAVRGIDTILHLAGLLPGADPLDMHKVNIQGTASLLAACARAGCRRFVLMSSTAVYARILEPSAWPLTEQSPLGPRAPGPTRSYGWSKVCAERLVRRAAAAGGFEHVIIRPSTCYGPGNPDSDALLRSALTGPVATARSRVLQYLQVDDAARMVAHLASAAADRDIVHIAGPDALTWPVVQSIVRRATGVPAPSAGPALERYVRPYDLSLARALGAVPRTSLREGLTELVRAHDQQADGVLTNRRMGSGRGPEPWPAAGGRPDNNSFVAARYAGRPTEAAARRGAL